MKRLFVLGLLVSGLLVSCGGEPAAEGGPGDTGVSGDVGTPGGLSMAPAEGTVDVDNLDIDVDPVLDVSSQSLEQGAIVINSATVQDDGWIVIHEGSAEGEVLGESPVFGGLNPRTAIDLTKEVPAGTTLWAGLYRDLGEVGTYEPGVDEPVKDGETPLGQSFEIE